MRTIVFGSLLLFVLQACGNASSPEYESGDGLRGMFLLRI